MSETTESKSKLKSRKPGLPECARGGFASSTTVTSTSNRASSRSKLPGSFKGGRPPRVNPALKPLVNPPVAPPLPDKKGGMTATNQYKSRVPMQNNFTSNKAIDKVACRLSNAQSNQRISDVARSLQDVKMRKTMGPMKTTQTLNPAPVSREEQTLRNKSALPRVA